MPGRVKENDCLSLKVSFCQARFLAGTVVINLIGASAGARNPCDRRDLATLRLRNSYHKFDRRIGDVHVLCACVEYSIVSTLIHLSRSP